MKRVLLLLAACAVALAIGMLLLQRHGTPALGFAPPPALPANGVSDTNSVKLSYVELAASPHRSEQAGATQVYGWLARGDDKQPVSGGTLRVLFQNFATASGSAAEEHAQALATPRKAPVTFREVPVQDDGGWFVDLPGKCWIASAEYVPSSSVERHMVQYLAADMSHKPSDAEVLSEYRAEARRRLIATSAPIDAPLEHGALELSFEVSPGLQAHGLVFDAKSAEPIEGAEVVLQSTHTAALGGLTGPDGGFEIYGIDPRELDPEAGMIGFLVQAKDHEQTVREVPWETGQSGIPAFKVVLEPISR